MVGNVVLIPLKYGACGIWSMWRQFKKLCENHWTHTHSLFSVPIYAFEWNCAQIIAAWPKRSYLMLLKKSLRRTTRCK